MTSVYHQTIDCLQLNTQNSLVIGVIITSLNTKTFQLISKYGGGPRAVWTFTLRDSEKDTINVTVWGKEEYINNLYSTFHIGDVVDVINSKIQNRPVDEKNEKFLPVTSCQYNLTVNEGSSLIHKHESANRGFYESLLRIPMKDASSIQSLKSILENIDSLQDQYVTLLTAVTFVSDSRNLVTKDGRPMVCRDFEVNDGTAKENIALKLWENEWIQRSAHWEPKKTVLFLSDVFVTFDKFKKKLTMMIVRKTMITENPNIPETSEIREAISHTDSDSLPHDPFILPKPESIKQVMTIKQITERLNQNKLDNNNRVQFVTILYATVIEVNMENNQNIFITRCALCKRLISEGQDSCMNLECPCGNGKREPTNIHNFYLKINLKDETGYLIGCRLTGPAAERALGCTVDEYKAMTQAQRAELKWRLALEHCDVRLQVLGPTLTFPRSLYNIISLKRLKDDEDQ